MAYWRMQLHPADSANAMKYSVASLGAGFIGLNFAGDLGDLRRVERLSLPKGQTDYWDFAHGMAVGDRVLVIVHHFPFALTTVSDDYNYIGAPDPKLGIWFRHFRRIDPRTTVYFADRVTNVRQWEQYRMTDTISRLKAEDGQSFRLIDEWAGQLETPVV